MSCIRTANTPAETRSEYLLNTCKSTELSESSLSVVYCFIVIDFKTTLKATFFPEFNTRPVKPYRKYKI